MKGIPLKMGDLHFKCSNCLAALKIPESQWRSRGTFHARCLNCKTIFMVEPRGAHSDSQPHVHLTIEKAAVADPSGQIQYIASPPPFRPDLQELLKEYEKVGNSKPKPPSFLIEKEEELSSQLIRSFGRSENKPPLPKPLLETTVSYLIYGISVLSILVGAYFIYQQIHQGTEISSTLMSR